MKNYQLQRIVIDIEQKQEENIIFTSEQKHYIYNVLRLKDGDSIIVMDGKGKTWLVCLKGEFNQIIKTLEQDNELPINITLICALPKSNSFDEIIRCCTELGVNDIMPVISKRTLLKPSNNKVQRWRKIAIEASEQSERQIVPNILDPLPFSKAITQINLDNTDAYIALARGENPHLLSYLQNKFSKNIVIMTGTEGGWEDEEIALAINAKFKGISLGKRVLRAVTAPIMALSLISSYSEL